MNKSFSQILGVLMAFGSLILLGSVGHAVNLQPDETNSEDVFTYQFAGPGFGISPSAANQNLDTESLAALGTNSPIGLFLGTSRSETTPHPTLGDTGHDGFSWIKFDLSGAGIAAADVANAKLRLWSVDGFGITGAFANPSAAESVTTEVYAAAGAWNEKSLTWNNQAPVVPSLGSPVDSTEQSGVEEWVEFTVTDLVKDWLSGSEDNDGFFLRQSSIVPTATSTGGATGVVSSLYASSAWSDATLRPNLQISPVPEPSTWGLMGMGLIGLVLIKRRVSKQ